MTTKSVETQQRRSGFGIWAWVMIAVVLFLVGAPYFDSGRDIDGPGTAGETAPREADRSRVEEQFKQEISRIISQTDSKNREAYETAMTDLFRIINDRFDRAEEGIEPAVSELTSLMGCAKLSYLMIKDRFSGTCETEERIHTVLDRHIAGNLVDANRDMENVLARFNDALACNATDMRVRLASLADTILSEEDETVRAAFRGVVERLGRISESFRSFASDATVPAVGLTLSALLVKSTYGQATRLLGHIARRFGKTTAIALSSAAADGPSPFLDVFGVGVELVGTACCGYELYKAQVTLKHDVTTDLTDTLARYRQEALDLGKQRARDLIEAYHDQNVRIATDLGNPLS